jgi:PilX N-terminal
MAHGTGGRYTVGDERGSVLIIGLVSVLVITLLGFALFDLGLVDHRLATSDRDTERAFYAAEAGLQRALLDLSDADGTNDFAAVQANPASLTGFANQPFSTASYTVTAATAGLPANQVRLTATGCAPASVCPDGGVRQIVQALAFLTNGLPGPLLGNSNVNFSGGGLTDSFNSNNGNYVAATANSKGDILGNGTISFDGTNLIKGSVRSTTDTKADPDVAISSGTSVTGYAQSGGQIQDKGTGNVAGGLIPNAPTTPIPVPSVAPCGPPYSSGTGISPKNSYNPALGELKASSNVTLANGTYCFNTVKMSGGGDLLVNGPVTVKVTGTVAMNGSVENTTHKAINFQLLSSYTGSNNGIALSGGAQAYMVVYAPRTQVTISGNGDLFGALVGNDIQATGGAKVHYDEALLINPGLQGGVPGYKFQAWKHCPSSSCP